MTAVSDYSFLQSATIDAGILVVFVIRLITVAPQLTKFRTFRSSILAFMFLCLAVIASLISSILIIRLRYGETITLISDTSVSAGRPTTWVVSKPEDRYAPESQTQNIWGLALRNISIQLLWCAVWSLFGSRHSLHAELKSISMSKKVPIIAAIISGLSFLAFVGVQAALVFMLERQTFRRWLPSMTLVLLGEGLIIVVLLLVYYGALRRASSKINAAADRKTSMELFRVFMIQREGYFVLYLVLSVVLFIAPQAAILLDDIIPSNPFNFRSSRLLLDFATSVVSIAEIGITLTTMCLLLPLSPSVHSVKEARAKDKREFAEFNADKDISDKSIMQEAANFENSKTILEHAVFRDSHDNEMTRQSSFHPSTTAVPMSNYSFVAAYEPMLVNPDQRHQSFVVDINNSGQFQQPMNTQSIAPVNYRHSRMLPALPQRPTSRPLPQPTPQMQAQNNPQLNTRNISNSTVMPPTNRENSFNTPNQVQSNTKPAHPDTIVYPARAHSLFNPSTQHPPRPLTNYVRPSKSAVVEPVPSSETSRSSYLQWISSNVGEFDEVPANSVPPPESNIPGSFPKAQDHETPATRGTPQVYESTSAVITPRVQSAIQSQPTRTSVKPSESKSTAPVHFARSQSSKIHPEKLSSQKLNRVSMHISKLDPSLYESRPDSASMSLQSRSSSFSRPLVGIDSTVSSLITVSDSRPGSTFSFPPPPDDTPPGTLIAAAKSSSQEVDPEVTSPPETPSSAQSKETGQLSPYYSRLSREEEEQLAWNVAVPPAAETISHEDDSDWVSYNSEEGSVYEDSVTALNDSRYVKQNGHAYGDDFERSSAPAVVPGSTMYSHF
ncbi:hypothetical protein BKA69DRAFT_1173778 [Paraphysoderma sedebokerense]|nr:hypothetical protein BKA69DRAFT_1173778 [Paraphysoderma sedebokerense]